MSKLIEAIETVQIAVREKFGAGDEIGIETVAIAAERVDVTDKEGTIVAEGAEHVARYLEKRS